MTESSKYSFFVQDQEEQPEEEIPATKQVVKERFNYTAPKSIMEEAQKETGGEEDVFRKQKLQTLEDKYTARKKMRLLSPERQDVYTENRDEDAEQGHRSYAEIMNQQRLENERTEIE